MYICICMYIYIYIFISIYVYPTIGCFLPQRNTPIWKYVLYILTHTRIDTYQMTRNDDIFLLRENAWNYLYNKYHVA